MKKWKIEINAESQHHAIHMLTELLEQFVKAELQYKTVGHMLASGTHGSVTVEGDCPGHITFTEKMLEDFGTDRDFYRLAKNDTLHCQTQSVYDNLMEQCLKLDIKAFGNREKMTVRFYQNVNQN